MPLMKPRTFNRRIAAISSALYRWAAVANHARVTSPVNWSADW